MCIVNHLMYAAMECIVLKAFFHKEIPSLHYNKWSFLVELTYIYLERAIILKLINYLDITAHYFIMLIY